MELKNCAYTVIGAIFTVFGIFLGYFSATAISGYNPDYLLGITVFAIFFFFGTVCFALQSIIDRLSSKEDPTAPEETSGDNTTNNP